MMRALQGGTRLAFLAFFVSHIVFILCIDLQAIFKPWYPQILQDLVTTYAATVMDPHMSEPFELWFQSFVFFELIFQLPFFFTAVYMFLDGVRSTYPRWFQAASIIYGSHTATTLIPILPSIWFRSNEEAPIELRLLVLSIYLPYFIFPVWIAQIAACDTSGYDPVHIQQKKDS